MILLCACSLFMVRSPSAFSFKRFQSATPEEVLILAGSNDYRVVDSKNNCKILNKATSTHFFFGMDKVRLVVYFLYTGVIEGWWYATIWILSIQLSNRIVRSWVVPRNVRGVKLHRLKSVITRLDKFAIFFANLSLSFDTCNFLPCVLWYMSRNL